MSHSFLNYANSKFVFNYPYISQRIPLGFTIHPNTLLFFNPVCSIWNLQQLAIWAHHWDPKRPQKQNPNQQIKIPRYTT